jgi:KipI family sensor histidine kinase inhibitor
VELFPLGDSGLLIHLGETVDAALNARVHALAGRLRAARLDGVVDIVPGYASVAAVFGADADARDTAARIQTLLEFDGARRAGAPPAAPRTVVIPVCYGGDFGPDLAHVARHAGLAADVVIARHAAGDYRVAMLGFQPGFPYLIGLDAALATPRHATPRPRVAAGSVGIGGAQTGVYPGAAPGGWQLIGRTPLAMFDAARRPPALLAPGDRVRFEAIPRSAFDTAKVRIE